MYIRPEVAGSSPFGVDIQPCQYQVVLVQVGIKAARGISFKKESYCVDWAGLELTEICLPLPLLSAGVKGVHHHAMDRGVIE